MEKSRHCTRINRLMPAERLEVWEKNQRKMFGNKSIVTKLKNAFEGLISEPDTA